MPKYIELENGSVMKVGTSLMVTLPSSFVKKNGIQKGDMVTVKWNGGKDLLIVAKKE
ncbi:MAG: AbrB/MazE/SpoVT family DNA-binding domain-containing protein [Candidatus Thorarchaeota archaeon]